MVVKDKVVSWFLQHYIIPRSQIIDKPGFVVFKISYKTDIYSRQIVLPESLFVSIEKNFTQKYGRVGEQALYSTGKKFGYRFSKVSHAINIKDSDEKSFLKFVNVLSKFVEGTYASNITNEVDMKNLAIKFRLNNFVVCRKSGIGHIFSAGGIAGIWANMLADTNAEGIQIKCQGRGDKICEVVAAPRPFLKKYGQRVMTERDLGGLEMHNEYRSINEIRGVLYAKNSLKDLIDAGIFQFHNGILSYNDDRYFIVEASVAYLLERELKKLKGGESLLFNLSFDYGKELAGKQKKQDPCKFIMDFMSPLGWGDVFAIKENEKYVIRAICFPWTEWHKESKHVIFRGMLSGIISGFLEKKVVLKEIKTGFYKGAFLLVCNE